MKRAKITRRAKAKCKTQGCTSPQNDYSMDTTFDMGFLPFLKQQNEVSGEFTINKVRGKNHIHDIKKIYNF